MTDLGRGTFKQDLGQEKNNLLRSRGERAAGESAVSYFINGPKLPNWSLGMQVSLELVKVAYSVRATKELLTIDTFDTNTIGELNKPYRERDTSIQGRGGDYKRTTYLVDDPELIQNNIPEFENLTRQDLESIEDSNSAPRSLYTEVVASDDIINSHSGSSGSALDLKPLSENELILVHYYGGAYSIGNPEVYRGFALTLSKKTGVRVFTPSYRYAPENPFPACIYDGLIFFKHLLKCGFKPENIVVSGDSAGGNLAAVLLLLIKAENMVQPRGCILYSPWTDLSYVREQSNHNSEYDFIPATNIEYIGTAARIYVAPGKPLDDNLRKLLNNPIVSPVYGDFSDCAPIYIQAGEAEVLLYDIDYFAEHINCHPKIVLEGRTHPGFSNITERNIYESYVGMVHVFFLFGEADEAHAAVDGVNNFLKRISGF
ncbi:Esterase [Smittium culicis]|uniref:Esterase n=1 Tax=Smittium culicis TaxID=133412 RepID=A0A1R1Y2P0_9FUNG|nr:Esterase [Smittium culicis]